MLTQGKHKAACAYLRLLKAIMLNFPQRRSRQLPSAKKDRPTLQKGGADQDRLRCQPLSILSHGYHRRSFWRLVIGPGMGPDRQLKGRPMNIDSANFTGINNLARRNIPDVYGICRAANAEHNT